MNCLAGVGREPGEKYEEGRRGRGENYQHLELISNQSRSGSISSVSFHCYDIIINSSPPLNQVSLQSKSSTLSSTTSETSSSERRSSSTRARSSNMMVTGSAVSSPALSSASVSTGSSPVLRVNTFEHRKCSNIHNSLRGVQVHSTHPLLFFARCTIYNVAMLYLGIRAFLLQSCLNRFQHCK